IGPDNLRIRELMARLAGGDITELILATDPNTEGEATATYLALLVKPMGIAVTRLAGGLPVGGDLEYADGVKLGRAFAGRRAREPTVATSVDPGTIDCASITTRASFDYGAQRVLTLRTDPTKVRLTNRAVSVSRACTWWAVTCASVDRYGRRGRMTVGPDVVSPRSPIGDPEAVLSGAGSLRIEGRSLGRIAWTRLKRDRVAMAGGAVVLFLVFVAIFAPLIVKVLGHPPNDYNNDLIDPNLGGL